jgi:hypothetical protein
LNALELQLAELTDDRAAGDIVVGVEQVAVLTAGLMSLLAMIRPRLECQNRKLTVHGLRPECAGVLCGSGLEHLIEPANRQATVVPGAPRLFQPALSARSRGSERAA